MDASAAEIRRITLLLIDMLLEECASDFLAMVLLASFLGRAAYRLTENVDDARKLIEFSAAAAIKGLPLLEKEDETEH